MERVRRRDSRGKRKLRERLLWRRRRLQLWGVVRRGRIKRRDDGLCIRDHLVLKKRKARYVLV